MATNGCKSTEWIIRVRVKYLFVTDELASYDSSTTLIFNGHSCSSPWFYSDDVDELGSSWKPVRTADGETKSFPGNTDSNTVKVSSLVAT